MKYLIFGSSGMAGSTIATYLEEKGHDVTGFSRNIALPIKTITGDVMNIKLVEKTVIDGNYDVIINCIGILNQFAENNPDKAVYLNSYFPHFLASITKKMKTKVIFMSTDCVFSGEKGGYTESDVPDGKTLYDRSKALGEVIDDKNLTLRTSIIGPDLKAEGIGLLNWFMNQEGRSKGFTKALWTGVTTLELAKIMENAALNNVTGLINMVYKEPISKFNLLVLLNKYLKENSLKIEPFEDFVSDKSLIRTNLSFKYEVPEYEIMIREMAIWIKNKKEKYPHYNL